MSERPEPGRAMFLQWFVRLAAWLPVVAAGLWASFASRLPEPAATRAALGEMTAQWDFESLRPLAHQPIHGAAQAFHLGWLQIPGMTLQWAAFGNVLLVLLIVVVATGCVRRAFHLDAIGTAFARLVLGLGVCSPAFGADWLYAERDGLFLVVLLLLLAGRVLQGERAFAGRALLAMLFVVLAPLCHANGVVVFAALVPSLFDAARRAGGRGTGIWLSLWLLVGAAAAVVSLLPTGTLSLPDGGFFERVLSSPREVLDTFVCRLGGTWFDALPGTNLDERVLGGATLLVPFVAFWFGDRSDEGRRAAAIGWSLWWFGVLLVAWQLEHYGATPAYGTARELGFGSVLLPIGSIVLLAASFGVRLLPLGAGALCVLALQDWHSGIEVLRQARLGVETHEALSLLPEAIVSAAHPIAPSADETALLAQLQQRGWVPPAADDAAALLDNATFPDPVPLGGCAGGDATSLHGTVRSSLVRDTVQIVVVTARIGAEPARIVGAMVPQFVGQGREVPWNITLRETLPEGARVHAIGVFAPRHQSQQLGPAYVVRGGVLEVDDKP